MSNTNVFINAFIETAPTPADLSVIGNMLGDCIFRTLAVNVLRDTYSVGAESIQAVRSLDGPALVATIEPKEAFPTSEEQATSQNVEANEQVDSYFKRRIRRIGAAAFLPVIGVYTACDELVTGPTNRYAVNSVKDLPRVMQEVVPISSLLVISGGLAFGLSMWAKSRREKGLLRHRSIDSVEVSAEQPDGIDAPEVVPKIEVADVAPRQYSAESFSDTTAMGVPLRAAMGSLEDTKSILVHSLYYVTVAQALLYSALDKLGVSNGLFYTAIFAYVSNKFTKDIYWSKKAEVNSQPMNNKNNADGELLRSIMSETQTV